MLLLFACKLSQVGPFCISVAIRVQLIPECIKKTRLYHKYFVERLIICCKLGFMEKAFQLTSLKCHIHSNNSSLRWIIPGRLTSIFKYSSVAEILPDGS